MGVDFLDHTFWNNAVDKFIKHRKTKFALNESGEAEYRRVLAIRSNIPYRKNYVGAPSLKVYAFLKEHNIKEPKLSDLEEYVLYLIKRRLKVKTVRKQVYIIRPFFRYLNNNGIYLNNIGDLEPPKDKSTKDKLQKRAVTPEIFFSLLDLMDPENLMMSRNRAIIAVSFCTGARIGAVLGLRKRDFVYNSRRDVYELTFGELKRRNETETDEIPKIAAREIENYLDKVKREKITLGAGDYLFFSVSNQNFGKRLTVSGMSTTIKNYFRKLVELKVIDETEIYKFSAHSLKYGFLNLLLSVGMPVEDIQVMGKHKSISTTYRYLNSFIDEQTYKEVDNIFSILKEKYEAGELPQRSKRLRPLQVLNLVDA